MRWLILALVALSPTAAWAGNGAYLGVELLSITPELRVHYGAPESSGVLLARVAEDSPAAAAGLRVGDILVSLNGRPILNFSDAVLLVSALKPGDTVEVEFIRDGASLETSLALAARKGPTRVRMGPFQWRGPAPMIDERAFQDSIRELQKRLGTLDSRKIMMMERTRRGLEGRIRALEDKIAELERRLGDAT